MERAINQCDGDVHDWKANRALAHRVFDAGFNRRDPLTGNGPAGDLVDKLKAFATRQWLHLNNAIAELAVPAGLLFVPAANLGVLTQTFFVGRRWRRGRNLNIEAPFQSLQHRAQVRLALALQ